MNRAEILDAVKQTICNDRQDIHGSPEQTHGVISDFWNAYLSARMINPYEGSLLTPQDVAVMMCLFKIARQGMNPKHLDSLVDLIGYAAIAVELGNYSDSDFK